MTGGGVDRARERPGLCPGREHCRVTVDQPPINTITATTVAELAELVSLIEQDAQRVVEALSPADACAAGDG